MEKLLEQLDFIYNNINAAQQVKGVLTLQDCRHFVISVDIIQTFLKEKTVIEERHKVAFDMIEKSCQLLQKQGVFTLVGSTQLINALDMIRVHMGF